MLAKSKGLTPGGHSAVKRSITTLAGELITTLRILHLLPIARKLWLVEQIHMRKGGAITPRLRRNLTCRL